MTKRTARTATPNHTVSSIQQRLSDALTAMGFHGKWWGPAGQPVSRFYFAARRKDTKAFLTFDNPETCYGAALKIFIEDNGACAAAWYRSQRKIQEDAYRPAFYAAMILAGQVEDAAKFLAEGLLSDEQIETLTEAGLL